KACPVDVEARRHYAEVMWRRGEHEVALSHLQHAMTCAPGDASLIIRGGQMHLEMGQAEEAKALADRALDITPQSPEAWALRAKAATATKQYEEALADYHRAIEYAPRDRELLFETAEAYRQLNRPQRALSTLI